MTNYLSNVNPVFVAITAAVLSRRIIMNLDTPNSALGYLRFFVVSLLVFVGWCFLLLILLTVAGYLSAS